MASAERIEQQPVELRAFARLMFVMLICRLGADEIPRHLPFLRFLDAVGTPEQWRDGLVALFFVGAALACFDRTFRFGCVLAGGALLAKVLGNMPLFSNGRTFDALLLLLAGLCTRLTLPRAQVILLYAGATLSKILDPDWWNGRFILAMFDYHGVPEGLYGAATAFGWATIATEGAIGLLLAIPRLRPWAILLMAVFHSALLLMLREDFATFYYSVALSTTLFFVEMPAIQVIDTPMPWLSRYSIFGAVRQAPVERGEAYVEFVDRSLEGFHAWLFLHLTNLPVAMVVLGTVATLGRLGLHDLREALLTVLLSLLFYLYFAFHRSRV